MPVLPRRELCDQDPYAVCRAHCLGLSTLELPAWQRCLGWDGGEPGVPASVYTDTLPEKSQTSGRRAELGVGGKWGVMVFTFDEAKVFNSSVP